MPHHSQSKHDQVSRLGIASCLCGTPWQFDRITVYRSRVDYLRNLSKLALAALPGYVREACPWFVNAEGQENPKGRVAVRLWRVARRSKRSLFAMKSRRPRLIRPFLS